MNTVNLTLEAKADTLQRQSEFSGVALACNLPADQGSEEQIWIPAGISHRIRIANPGHRRRLLTAIFDMEPDRELRLVLLGDEVDALRLPERIALRARLAFLPAAGGLLSNLNAWENIVLPLGFRPRENPRGIAGEVHTLLKGLGAVPEALLGKLPEEMTLLEKKIAGFTRILLESPDLVLVENFASGLDSTERARLPYFAGTYHANHPGGTFVQLEDVLAG
jgi:ABC-type iron transport system FetAB ATPase subunit